MMSPNEGEAMPMNVQTIRRSRDGVDYLGTILRRTKLVITRAVFRRVPHDSGREDICLKIGRYNRSSFNEETLQANDPKSELTFNNEEFRNLLQFIADNFEPFRSGVAKYIPLDESFDERNLDHLRAIFRNPDKNRLLRFIIENSILPDDLLLDIEHQHRISVVREFESMLSDDLNEHEWQRWLSKNYWILGSDFVRVLDDRRIDPDNIADYLVQAYDGFLDVVEIKRPGGGIRFWAPSLDHGNLIPSTALIRAITQAGAYIFEIEREINSQKFLERIGHVKTVKPRCVLVFGRSDDWGDDECRAFRILNSSYHNLSIMTYDHVLDRAKRIVGLEQTGKLSAVDDEIPF
jgi:hypothetical protein